MLQEYFASAAPVTAATAWKHVYRLLLWIDRSTGLAHCYESDKAQPGRPWYARSLAFHNWVAAALETSPAALADSIDWLFRRGTEKYAVATARGQAAKLALAATQRAPYAGKGFPEPGQDPELEDLILEELKPWLASSPPESALRTLTEHVRTYLSQENKRKNLVGEGFEDALSFVVARLPASGSREIGRAHV